MDLTYTKFRISILLRIHVFLPRRFGCKQRIEYICQYKTSVFGLFHEVVQTQ